jgi:hypothetical protein
VASVWQVGAYPATSAERQQTALACTPLAAFFVGTAIAIGIGSGLALGALSLAARCNAGSTPGERMCDRLLILACLAIALVQLAGFASAFHTLPITLAAVSCGGLALRHGVRAELSLLRADLRQGLCAVRRSPPLWAAGLLGMYLAIRGLQLPELSWDGLTYHLTYPALWLQTGGFARFEAGGVWEQYESFPKGGEALFALAMLPFHADHFVHWVNLPLWVGTGCALRCAALRMGVGRLAADSCAVLALGCPALSAYVTPAYVELPAAFGISAALAAALRLSAARQPAALLPLWLALGLGAAVKITGLAYLPLGLLATLLAMRALTPAACVRPAAQGVALAAFVAAPWYLHNLVQCDNPFYPAALPGATQGPAAGTLANVWAVTESSVLAQNALADVLEHLARPPWQVRYPLGPGWLYLAALPASLALCARGKTRAAPLLAAGAVGLLVLYLISPWNGVFREANTRFLMPSLMAALLSLTVAGSRGPAWLRRALGLCGAALVLLALARAHFLRDLTLRSAAPAAVLALIGCGVSCLYSGRRHWLQLGAGGLALWLLSTAVAARQANKLAAYSQAIDLHPVAMSPELWRYVDALPPSRIAFSVGDVNATEGWFFYPLFGTRLQHAPRYVDVEKDASPACARRGLIRDQPSEALWLVRLRAQRVDYLLLAGAPLEIAWVRAHPEVFRSVFSARGQTLYRVVFQPGDPADGA